MGMSNLGLSTILEKKKRYYLRRYGFAREDPIPVAPYRRGSIENGDYFCYFRFYRDPRGFCFLKFMSRNTISTVRHSR